MRNNKDHSIPVDELFVATIDAQPVAVEEWKLNDVEDESWNYFEMVTVGDTRVVVDAHHVLAALDSNGTLVHLDMSPDDDRESYIEDNSNEHGDPIEGSLSEDDLSRLDDEGAPTSGPAMNYWYPLDAITDPSEAIRAAVAIADLSLCVVEVNGVYGLALTGGGMDMSWDICAAYVAVGYLPPVHFADLPNLAGDNPSGYIFNAMVRSLNVMAERSLRQVERLRERFPTLAGTIQ